jgi:hypothetical protein
MIWDALGALGGRLPKFTCLRDAVMSLSFDLLVFAEAVSLAPCADATVTTPPVRTMSIDMLSSKNSDTFRAALGSAKHLKRVMA